MENVGNITPHVEFEDFPVIFKELFLRCYFSSSEFVFKIIFHFLVFLRNPLSISFSIPVVIRYKFTKGLYSAVKFIKFSCVLVAVIESDIFTENIDFTANSEVEG